MRRAGPWLSLIVVPSLAFAGDKSVLPSYELVRAKNGVPVYFFPNPNVPLFEIRLDFKGGSDIDPRGRSGLGMFAAGMIKRGVRGLDEEGISEKLDDAAGAVEINVDEESTTVSAYGLNAQAPVITELLFKELGQATFPEGPFLRLKHNHLDSIEQIPDSAGSLATQVLDSIVYNRTSKARPSIGLLGDVKSLSLEMARGHSAELFRTDHLRAFVVGGADRREILDRVVESIGDLPCPRCGAPVAEPGVFDFGPSRIPKGALVLVDRPGIDEAHVRMGFIGPKRNVPEFYDLRVADTILGGFFASRLNMIIREKLSLTYNISAGFTYGLTTGEFELATSTRNEKLVDLLAGVDKVLRGFASCDFTDDEIRMARDYLTGSFPLGLESIYVIAETFFSGLLNGLPPTFLDHYVDGVEAVTRESLSAAVRKYFKLDEMTTVIVGDRSALVPRLKKAKLRFVERRAKQFL